MSSGALPRAATVTLVDRFSRMSAGTRLVVLLTIALLPLGLLAVFSSLQISRSADAERRATVRVAALESARRVGAEMSVDTAAIRTAVDMLESGGNEGEICSRTLSVLATSFNEPTGFAIAARDGRIICGTPPVVARLADTGARGEGGAQLSRDGLGITVASDSGSFAGMVHYPRAQLARTTRPMGLSAEYSVAIQHGGRILQLASDFAPSALRRSEAIRADVPNAPLTLAFDVPSAPFTAAELLTIAIPIIMWLVASFLAWLIFNRLVIAPLGQLRANLATYRPGEIVQPLRRMTIPAREIDELGDTFQTISRTVAAHEEELARGLSRQTKLTREVHHRVKNNLQVVSSLINLHARAAQSREAASAYASIGRRVDALAVVHRNHFAEMEENRGVNVRSLIGELTTNLRANAQGEVPRLSILIDVPDVHVGQDTAIPLAFLTTELVEMAMTIDSGPAIRVSVRPMEDDSRACLAVEASSLADKDRVDQLLGERYGRVIEGLSRQLRSTLERDAAKGVFSVCFPITTAPEGDPEK